MIQVMSSPSGMRAAGTGSMTVSSSRVMERVLEEAQHSGELNLTGRKLKDLIAAFSTKCNLIDTIRADLSKNRFTELPVQVCHFVFMEQLNCRENSLRYLPKEMVHLKCLVELDISRNALTSLPEVVCQLPLQILRVSHNRLISLPDAIGKMVGLMELDASSNQITALPPQLGSLGNLRSLDLRNNQLANIPKEMALLRLVHLDLSQNRITQLPMDISAMHSLHSLELVDNPLESPPAQMCNRGIVHIFKSLERATNRAGSIDAGELTREQARSSFRKTPSTGDNIYQTPKNGIIKSHIVAERNATSDLKLIHETSPVNFLPSTSMPSSQSINGLVNSVKEESIARPVERVLIPESTVPSKEGQLHSDSSSSGSCSGEHVVPIVMQSVDGSASSRTATLTKKSNDSLIPRKISPMQPQVTSTSSRKSVPSPTQAKAPSVAPTKAMNGTTLLAAKQPVNEFKSRHENIVRSHRVAAERLLQEATVDSTNPVHKPPATRKDSLGSRSKPSSAGSNQSRSTSSSSASNKDFNPHFTMRRQQDQVKDETEKLLYLKKQLESRLKLTLPDDLLGALQDGVILCHFVNAIRPRSVISVHVPSNTQGGVLRLTSAKSRRNVDNFLDACRRIGVADLHMCAAAEILEGKSVVKIATCIHHLLQCESHLTAALPKRPSGPLSRTPLVTTVRDSSLV